MCGSSPLDNRIRLNKSEGTRPHYGYKIVRIGRASRALELGEGWPLLAGLQTLSIMNSRLGGTTCVDRTVPPYSTA